MPLYVLDTDHLSLLQSAHPRVSARYLLESAQGNVAVSVASYEEQVRGRLAFISQAKTHDRRVQGYFWLRQTQQFYCRFRLLDFDDQAQRTYQNLRATHRRTGKMDLKIAATALTNNAILVTRNTQDFISIANLRLENWA